MILMLSDLWVPFPGGAERLIFNLARDLMRRGEDVHVLTGYEHAQQFDGPPVTACPIGVFDTKHDGWEVVLAELDARRPDVVLTHHLYASQFGANLVHLGIPVVHVVLNGERLPGAKLAVFISKYVRDRAGACKGDLTITPPAFDDVVAGTHANRIGFIKPIDHKGVDLFYEVAAALPEREFVVLRGEWQDLEVIRPAPNITFMEPVVHMPDFYAEVNLLLVPSRSEDAGTVAQEATLNGLPCISSDAQGLAETNRGGVQLPVRFDAEGWVGAILALDDSEARARVVARQRAHLDSTRRDERLAEFHQRVRALGSRA